MQFSDIRHFLFWHYLLISFKSFMWLIYIVPIRYLYLKFLLIHLEKENLLYINFNINHLLQIGFIWMSSTRTLWTDWINSCNICNVICIVFEIVVDTWLKVQLSTEFLNSFTLFNYSLREGCSLSRPGWQSFLRWLIIKGNFLI